MKEYSKVLFFLGIGLFVVGWMSEAIIIFLNFSSISFSFITGFNLIAPLLLIAILIIAYFRTLKRGKKGVSIVSLALIPIYIIAFLYFNIAAIEIPKYLIYTSVGLLNIYLEYIKADLLRIFCYISGAVLVFIALIQNLRRSKTSEKERF